MGLVLKTSLGTNGKLSLSVGAAVREHHRLGGSDNRNVFSPGSGGWNFQTGVRGSGSGEVPLALLTGPSLERAARGRSCGS